MGAREGVALAQGEVRMVLGPYLSWVPSCSSGSGANVRTTVLCMRLRREEREEAEAYGVPAATDHFGFFCLFFFLLILS